MHHIEGQNSGNATEREFSLNEGRGGLEQLVKQSRHEMVAIKPSWGAELAEVEFGSPMNEKIKALTNRDVGALVEEARVRQAKLDQARNSGGPEEK